MSKDKSKDNLDVERQKVNIRKKQESGKNEKDVKIGSFHLPIWLRIFNVGIGLIFIIISSWIVINSDLSISTATNFLAFIIILMGITRFLNARIDKQISKNMRIVRFTVASTLIILGLLSYILPDLETSSTLFILAISLTIQGVGRVMVGLNNQVMPEWTKYILISIGSLTALIGLVAILPDSVQLDDDDQIINLLAGGFILAGIARITLGIAGYSEQKM